MFENLNYYFHSCCQRPDLRWEKEPNLFSPEETAYGVDLPFDTLSPERQCLIRYDAEVTDQDYKDLEAETNNLIVDIDYFLKTYKWVEKEETQRSAKRFFLFNNLACQLRRFLTRLIEYHQIIYHSIFCNKKEDFIELYNSELKDKLNDLYKTGIASCPNDYCTYSHVVNIGNECELLRCLQEHPIEAVRNEFERKDSKQFCEEYIFGDNVVFSFSQILFLVESIQDVIKEIERPKYAKRTIDECKIIFDELFELYKEAHPNRDDEYNHYLDQYLKLYELDRESEGIRECLQETKSNAPSGNNLCNIWVRYRTNNMLELIKEIVNAKATRKQFNEFFDYVMKIEYFENRIRSSVSNINEKVDSLLCQLTNEAIKNAPEEGEKGRWKAILKPLRAAIDANAIDNIPSRNEFNIRYDIKVPSDAYSNWITRGNYDYGQEINSMKDQFERLKKS